MMNNRTIDTGRTKKKAERVRFLLERKNARRLSHVLQTIAGVPRRMDGNKLGMRKRLLIG